MKDDKKRFKDTKVGQWLKGNAPDLLDVAGDVPGLGLLDVIGKALKGDPGITPEQELEYARLAEDYRKSHLEAISRRWEADMGSRYALPHLIRPVTLILLLTAILTFTALDSAEAVAFTVPAQWVDLLTTLGTAAFVAYFGGRSTEKILNR